MTTHPHVYRHQAAGFDGWRVHAKAANSGRPKYFSVIPEMAPDRKYAEIVERSFRKAMRWAKANIPPKRASRGVTHSRNTKVAWWCDPPGKLNRVYVRNGRGAQARAEQISRQARKLVAQGKSTKHLVGAR